MDIPAMRVNLHTHTVRCRHATGTEREYIERAIEGGFRVLGFSDHAPFRFFDGSEMSYRVPCDRAREYLETIAALRDEYADRIEIHAGFELEYYPSCFEPMMDFVRSLGGCEYLILGQHQDNYPVRYYTNEPSDDPERLERYTETIISGIGSGAFTYIAHPDILNFHGNDTLYYDKAVEIGRAAAAHGVPLEINFLGIRDHRSYPCSLFWEAVGTTGAPVVFGCDAHEPESAWDPASEKIAADMVRRYGLNLVPAPVLRKID